MASCGICMDMDSKAPPPPPPPQAPPPPPAPPPGAPPPPVYGTPVYGTPVYGAGPPGQQGVNQHNIMTVQPWTGPGKPGVWQESLCGCCCDMSPDNPTACGPTCCCAMCCCMLCVYSDAATKSQTDLMTALGQSTRESAQHGYIVTCLGLCGAGDVIVPCSDLIARFLARQAVTRKYQINESEITNFMVVCCCSCCVLDQQLHEIMVREEFVFNGCFEVKKKPGAQVRMPGQ